MNRYDFVLLFDVMDGNPNGDPDADNLPRMDPGSGHGLVTDVCLKRKLRNYVSLTKMNDPNFDIFIKEKSILNQVIEKSYQEAGIDITSPTVDEKKKKKFVPTDEQINTVQSQMCKKYFDIRTFGAVLSTGANAGQVRGPLQLTFARSIDPIMVSNHAITRMAVASEKESEKHSGVNQTMGRKATIPYALYRAYGFVNAFFADKTNFSDEDLSLVWTAFEQMFEFDRSSARGFMTTRKLIIFKHNDKLGDCHANECFSRVKIARKSGVDEVKSYDDYLITIDDQENSLVRVEVPAKL